MPIGQLKEQIPHWMQRSGSGTTCRVARDRTCWDSGLNGKFMLQRNSGFHYTAINFGITVTRYGSMGIARMNKKNVGVGRAAQWLPKCINASEAVKTALADRLK